MSFGKVPPFYWLQAFTLIHSTSQICFHQVFILPLTDDPWAKIITLIVFASH